MLPRMAWCAVLLDWGGTLMAELPGQRGPMADWPEVRVLPGVAEALPRLAARWPCHLATNAADSDEPAIRRALERGGIGRWIGRIYCQRGLGLCKPDPRFWAAIAADLGLPPGGLLMIGDDLAVDVHGALAAGLQAAWYAPEGVPPSGVRVLRGLADLG